MAGFFSNIFGGGAEREAANNNRAAYSQYGIGANNILGAGLQNSIGSLQNANTAASGYLGQNTGLYGDLRNAGTGILDRGRADSLAALNSGANAASAAYDPLATLAGEYGRGRSLYQDSLGINGAAGNANAVNSFQAGPGYQWQLDQGNQAINRRRAAAGMLDSGNADVDALRFGQGLANQTYGSWQDRLAGFVNPELQATSAVASGRAGIASGLGQNSANIIGQDTLSRLGLEQGVTQGQAGVNTAQANNAVALGNSLAGLNTQDAQNRVGVLGNQTTGNVSANNLQAQGEAQGSRNLLNAGLGLASLVAGMPGGVPGMGGGGTGSTAGSFGNLFGGGGTLFGNGTGYNVNPWSAGGQFGGR